jgi:hypothetical protein
MDIGSLIKQAEKHRERLCATDLRNGLVGSFSAQWYPESGRAWKGITSSQIMAPGGYTGDIVYLARIMGFQVIREGRKEFILLPEGEEGLCKDTGEEEETSPCPITDAPCCEYSDECEAGTHCPMKG